MCLAPSNQQNQILFGANNERRNTPKPESEFAAFEPEPRGWTLILEE